MAPAARTAPPLPAGPAPGVFGPRRLTRRLAHTAYTLHTASSHTRQPHGHHELKIFSKLFLRFLDTAGITRDRLIYQVQIHESADVRAAQEFWLSVSGADPESSGARPSSGITPGQCARTRARTTTAVCASRYGAVPGCTGRSRGGRQPP